MIYYYEGRDIVLTQHYKTANAIRHEKDCDGVEFSIRFSRKRKWMKDNHSYILIEDLNDEDIIMLSLTGILIKIHNYELLSRLVRKQFAV